MRSVTERSPLAQHGVLTPRSLLFMVGVASLLALSSSCSRETVQVYESAPKTRVMAHQAAEDSSEHRFRMLAAIADRSDATWFLKLAGTIEDIEQVKSAWDQFLASLSFAENGEPTWTLPEGWTRGAGSSMRYATLLTGDADSPEIAVSSLPPGQDLLDNVNRWRGQLGLPPTDPIQLEIQLSTVEASGETLKLFDETGPQYSTGMGAPFANRAAPPTPPVDARDESNISYAPPTGWTPGETSSVTRDRWTLDQGEDALEIAVLQMNSSDESWNMNVGAWASQMNMPDEVDVAAGTQSFKVAGQQGRRIRLDQGGDAESPMSLVAVMFDLDGTGWLLKYSGNTELLDEQMHVFDAFVQSISRTD